jgi:hypothetical protein
LVAGGIGSIAVMAWGRGELGMGTRTRQNMGMMGGRDRTEATVVNLAHSDR